MTCQRCVLPDNFPRISFDENHICNFCHEFDSKKSLKTNERELINEAEVIDILQQYNNLGNKYDLLVCLSGGVDSSNALIKLVEEYHLNPLCFHNDHGFEDEIATQNVKSLCSELKVDLIIWQHDLWFMKKLWKSFNESNVKDLSGCYVCGNILYLNSLQLADKFDIHLVINGYSKGQARMTNNKERGNELLGKMLEVIEKTNDIRFINEFRKKYNIMQKCRVYESKKDLESIDPSKIFVVPFYIFDFNKTDKENLMIIPDQIVH